MSLEVEGLEARYGAAKVLHDVSLTVARGEVVALIGRNGAGKSTSFKAIMGLLPPTGGRVRFQGVAIERRPSFEIARLGLAYVPEERRIFPDLTVMENLSVGRQPPREGAPRWTPERLFELFPNLGRMRHRPGGRMSGGEQQMLTLARGLMGNPSMILLDEPSEGLAPKIVAEMATTIQALKSQGLAVLLSEQNLGFAAKVADRAYVIQTGVIRYNGAMAEILGDEAVRRTYLAV